MSDERRKTNKQSTGTVPKIRYHNNTSLHSLNDQERSQRSLANNLSAPWHQLSDSTNFILNSRTPQNNYFAMDTTLEEQNLHPTQNGMANYIPNTNSVTPNTSSSTSRRNSAASALKCDNVTKCPEKKQIEDTLSQIREYLQITNSLMTSMKNTEDQINDQAEKNSLTKMINDLKDSEQKLVNILEDMNESEVTVEIQPVESEAENISENSMGSVRRNEVESHDLDVLKEQQLTLMKLQQKAENKLKDARLMQDKMLMAQYGNEVNMSNPKGNKNMSISDFDMAIKELEERAKRLNHPRQTNQNVEDKILTEVEHLHNKIITMHNANNEREQLIEVLDNRDVELRTQQAELQNKLVELQNKKQQIDQLVVQLQTIDDEDEDVGGQVRKIVTMKDQLKKLKDMLEIVKTTESVMSNTNASAEAQAAACDICTTAENFLQNEIQKPRSHSNDSNVTVRYDNNTSNENLQKQVNKSTRDQRKGAKPRTDSINEKVALQAELEAKKKELEEIMGKHKAGTSNLNHDVGNDIKSEFSCASNSNSNALNDRTYWRPLMPLQNQDDTSDRFSSDECEDDEYAELHENQNLLPLQPLNYTSSNGSKLRSDNNSDYVFPSESMHGVSRTPERNLRSSSVATSGYVREPSRSNSEQDKLQKQLQLIKSVCDSMLAQQNSSNAQSNVQQLRNNLTPSPLYSEPRRFASVSPNPHSMNALNVLNTEVPWLPNNGHSTANAQAEMNNYQSWMATNNLQTQSFMLNTLNQCCQMLWLQQRELVALRNSVTLLQERVDATQYSPNGHLPPSTLPHPPLDQRVSNHYRPSNPVQKANHVSAACSLPNLNHYNALPSNLDPTYANHNNLQNSRLLDPLNNINHLNQTQGVAVENANNVLHGVNANINQAMPTQLWNGQALNNQVAPGNRANNYWDNFRSYSRQNLLSTKNNEGIHHNPPPSAIDRSNIGNERTNPFSLMSFSKSNSEQDSASSSHENTPQRRAPFKAPPRHVDNSNATIPPPDVLNVNHNVIKPNERVEPPTTHHDTENMNIGFHMLNLNSFSEPSNILEEHIFKETVPRRRNEWNNQVQEEHTHKSKLFEELRDNVYKEVASLISANEARPHFLIQLFRDLQMIGSDSLRLNILQSIQSVITHSLVSSQNSNRQSLDSHQPRENDHMQLQDFSLQSTVWSKPTKNVFTSRNIINLENDGLEVQNTFKEIIPFLNEHDDEIIQNHLITSLKQMFLESESFKETVKDTIFQKHFSNVLDEVLEQYCGKKVRDTKVHLVQTVSDLFKGELSFIQLIQETNPENCPPLANNDINNGSVPFNPAVLFESHQNQAQAAPMDNNIQNGDLAEADQSRVTDDDMEEEGAVGGIIEVKSEMDAKILTQGQSVEVLNLQGIDFSSNSEGLDQVPTRLATRAKSRTPTPNKDRSNSDPDLSF